MNALTRPNCRIWNPGGAMRARWIQMSVAIGLTLSVLPTASLGSALGKPAPVRVDLKPPRSVPAAGETFRVPVYVQDRGAGVVSYALQVRYDPAVLEIVAIDGGTF